MPIYWINAHLGVSARPRGGDWLVDDVREWKVANVGLVVSMLTLDEVREFDLGAEEPICRENGIDFRSFPVPDRTAPTTLDAVHEVAQAVASGKRVVIHCRQGIGRAGVVAAAVLVERGASPEAAIAVVEEARGRPVPDTSEQLAWVLGLRG